MMFLVQGELKGACPLPAKAWMERVVRELEMSVEHEQSGKALAGGTYVGRKGGCLILDVQSVDELNALVSRFPLHPFIDWEVIPLVSFEKSLQGAKQALGKSGVRPSFFGSHSLMGNLGSTIVFLQVTGLPLSSRIST